LGKKIDVVKYVEDNRLRFARLRAFPEKRVRGNRRPRSAEDVLLFERMIRARRENWLRAGIVEILGPRRIRINLPKPGQPVF